MTGVRRLLSGLTTAQERVERTPAGQGLISGLILTAVLTGIVWNLPPSAIKRQVLVAAAPIGFATGLGQTWDVFAPNPPRQNDEIWVVVSFSDGVETQWHMPRGDPLVGTYVVERWHKVREYLLKTPSLRPTFAHWVVRQVTQLEQVPVRVRIFDQTTLLPVPGSSAQPQPT